MLTIFHINYAKTTHAAKTQNGTMNTILKRAD